MLNWKRILSEWAHVARQHAGLSSGVTMAAAILSGPVPADVWRDRIRVCLKCPILDRETMACRRVLSDGSTLGCGCHAPLLALTAAPYPKGCFARQLTEREGWPIYTFPSRRAKIRAVWQFIFPPKSP